MKKVIVFICVVLFALSTNAQQIGALGHSYLKPIVYNPALTGASGYANAMLISKLQWTGFKGAPQLNVFNFDGNLRNKNIGLGVGLISDKKGLTNRVGGNFAYAYRLRLNKDIDLHFGISAGLINQSHDFSSIVVETSGIDPAISSDKQNKLTYDANAGFVFKWKALVFGASSPQIIGNKVEYKSDTTVSSYTQSRHYIGHLQYKFFVNEEKGIAIIPNAIVRVVANAPLQYDGTVSFDWQDKFWVGATYKSAYAVGANAGVCIKKRFCIGYSYDFGIGSISSYSGMTHEIMLNFKFGKKEENQPDEIDETVEVAPLEVAKDSIIAEVEDVSDAEEVKQLSDLNSLLVLNLIKEIEDLLDDANATSGKILDLKMRIAMFDNTAFADASLKSAVQDMAEKLQPPNQKSPDIIVRGNIVLEGADALADFSFVSVTIVDLDTEETVGTYTPNSKTGRYILILRPNKNYELIVENDGYELYIEELKFTEDLSSKEISKEIRLKKEGQ